MKVKRHLPKVSVSILFTPYYDSMYLQIDAETYKMLMGRRDQYRRSAMAAKKNSDIARAKKHMKTAKVKQSYEATMCTMVI